MSRETHCGRCGGRRPNGCPCLGIDYTKPPGPMPEMQSDPGLIEDLRVAYQGKSDLCERLERENRKQAAEIDRLRSRYVPCAVCQRPVDTWEECDGGDPYGCRLSRGRWACSIQCWDRFVVRSEAEQVGGKE
jgi:hypothetical protein